MSDIHGEYEKFMAMLEKIDLKDRDTLYVLGDVVDRGPHPIRTLLKMMEMPNVIPILGNHELMALTCLPFLREEITDDFLKRLDRDKIRSLKAWMMNGSHTTMEEFRHLDYETQDDVLDFMEDFMVYAEVAAGGKRFLLIHAGLGHFSPDKDLEDYALDDLVWDRADYSIRYFDDKEVVTGHTPTQNIEENPRPGYVYRANGHIAIDCGACFEGGRLAAVCLETGEEFYIPE